MTHRLSRVLLCAMTLGCAAGCGRGDAGTPGRSPPKAVEAPRLTSLAPVRDAPPGCLHYEPSKSALRGTLTRVTRYGPPNYGEDTLRDERLNVPILRLDSAVAVCGSPGDPANTETETDVREVQLVALDPARRPLPPAGDVVAHGELFHQVAGAHFTRVLMTVDSIRTILPPSR